MSSKTDFVKAYKEVFPDVTLQQWESAWQEELQRQVAEREEKAAQRAAEAEEKAAQRAAEAEEKAAEREFELEKLRIVQQRGGNGKFFLCYMRSLGCFLCSSVAFFFRVMCALLFRLISLHSSS
jgi:hypothetical protein